MSNTVYVKCDRCNTNSYCIPICVDQIHVGCGGLYHEISYDEAFKYAKNFYDETITLGYTNDQALDYVEDHYDTRIRKHIEQYNQARMNMYFT